MTTLFTVKDAQDFDLVRALRALDQLSGGQVRINTTITVSTESDEVGLILSRMGLVETGMMGVDFAFPAGQETGLKKCAVCGENFSPRRHNQLICGNEACRKAKQAEYVASYEVKRQARKAADQMKEEARAQGQEVGQGEDPFGIRGVATVMGVSGEAEKVPFLGESRQHPAGEE